MKQSRALFVWPLLGTCRQVTDFSPLWACGQMPTNAWWALILGYKLVLESRWIHKYRICEQQDRLCMYVRMYVAYLSKWDIYAWVHVTTVCTCLSLKSKAYTLCTTHLTMRRHGPKGGLHQLIGAKFWLLGFLREISKSNRPTPSQSDQPCLYPDLVKQNQVSLSPRAQECEGRFYSFQSSQFENHLWRFPDSGRRQPGNFVWPRGQEESHSPSSPLPTCEQMKPVWIWLRETRMS